MKNYLIVETHQSHPIDIKIKIPILSMNDNKLTDRSIV